MIYLKAKSQQVSLTQDLNLHKQKLRKHSHLPKEINQWLMNNSSLLKKRKRRMKVSQLQREEKLNNLNRPQKKRPLDSLIHF